MFQSSKSTKISSSILSADVEVYGDLKISNLEGVFKNN